jgi:hypothetical protein
MNARANENQPLAGHGCDEGFGVLCGKDFLESLHELGLVIGDLLGFHGGAVGPDGLYQGRR